MAAEVEELLRRVGAVDEEEVAGKAGTSVGMSCRRSYPSATDVDVTPGVRHVYRVKAINSADVGGQTNSTGRGAVMKNLWHRRQ